jgi:hypothetical protein
MGVQQPDRAVHRGPTGIFGTVHRRNPGLYQEHSVGPPLLVQLRDRRRRRPHGGAGFEFPCPRRFGSPCY